MAPGKLFVITDDSSSPEIYRRRKEKSAEGNNNYNERSYNCNYCKRGFTNAQALGGHMNIHRKDKAKTKQKIDIIEEEPSIHNTDGKETSSTFRYNPNRAPSFDDHHFQLQQQLNYYMSLREQASKYRVYLPPSNPNDTVRGGNLRASRDGYGRENLGLKIGLKPRVVVNDDGNKKRENDEVDLELRLGHNPKYGD